MNRLNRFLPPQSLIPSPAIDNFYIQPSLKKRTVLKNIKQPYVAFSFQSILTQLIRQTETILSLMQDRSQYLSSQAGKIKRTKTLSGISETYTIKNQAGSPDVPIKGWTFSVDYWKELQNYFEQDYADDRLPDVDDPRSIKEWVIDPSQKLGSIWDLDHSDHDYYQESLQTLYIYFSEHEQEMSNFCQEVQGVISTLTQRYNLCLNTDTSVSDIILQLKKQIVEGFNP